MTEFRSQRSVKLLQREAPSSVLIVSLPHVVEQGLHRLMSTVPLMFFFLCVTTRASLLHKVLVKPTLCSATRIQETDGI